MRSALAGLREAGGEKFGWSVVAEGEARELRLPSETNLESKNTRPIESL